jgi:hypothetical protein
MSSTDPIDSKPLRIAGIEIPVADQTPLLLALVEIIGRQERQIQELKDEIQKLKGTTQRPKISPSKLLKPDKPKPKPGEKRPGSAKRSKNKDFEVTDTIALTLDDLPEGTRIEGYRDFYVQDLVIQPKVILYRRTVYRLPDGTLRVAQRLEDMDSHFGVSLRQYILLQVHQNHVTQNRLLEELRERGIDISAGQISNILLNGHDAFHAEKDELLPTAREISSYLHCDDTSARHQGKAAVCTHIGNELFASFSTTDSKSRLNFLRLLCQGDEQYRWCEEAVVSLDWLGAGKKLLQQMAVAAEGVWNGRAAWESQLDRWEIKSVVHRRLVSEAALCGKLLTESWYDDLALISDDAPQFKLFGFVHGLCWVHGERKIDRLIPLAKSHIAAKERAQSEFWEIYADLKAYRESPAAAQRELIEKRFDRLCTSKTGYPDLNDALGRLHAKRELFLQVLTYPHLPLHNNLSENDIREYARLRKISAGTRSDAGKRCRDTFLSVKKTCRKLGVNFGAYLIDRLSGTGKIPRLSDLMRQAAASRNETATLESG